MIPSLRLVEDIPDWGTLVEVVGGEHHGATVLLVPATRVLPGATSRSRAAPAAGRPARLRNGDIVTTEHAAVRRAEALLESLLDDDQRAAWRSRRGFWVPTPYGAVELGRVSHLRFTSLDGRHLVLCVVPAHSSDLPTADIWTNLLLVLRAEPRRFFEVANYCIPGRAWQSGPVPLPSAPTAPTAPVPQPAVG
jgi:hypothetical protein